MEPFQIHRPSQDDIDRMALLGQHNEPLLQGNADVEHQSINHLSFHDSTDDHKSTKCGNKYCTCCKGRLCKCTLISVAVTLGLVIGKLTPRGTNANVMALFNVSLCL